jgi:uncharacterized repeat protein (TIGR01451 family)
VSPPQIEIPPIPDLPVPEAASAFVDAVVSITVYPPAYYDDREYHTDGLLEGADGLVLTVLNYTAPMERIEVEVPGIGTCDAAIERVDPSTGATLLRIAACGVPVSSVEGDAEVGLGEPVWLLDRDADTGKMVVREGYAAPATNEGARDTMFGLLPGGFTGYYGTLVVRRDGVLLGMVGTGSWYGTGFLPRGPSPGPARPVVKTTRLRQLVVGPSHGELAYVPAAVAYHTQTTSEIRGWLGDSPALRESLAGPVEKVLQSLGGVTQVESLGQTDNAVLRDRMGSVLELVFAQPQELRTATGELVGKARYVAFWWDRENGEPDVVLCGAEPGYICGAFLVGDLSDLKAAVEAAPESGRSGVMTDAYSLPGFPSYPLEMHVTTSSESYRPGETVTFTVTIENHSAWPIVGDHLPPGIVIQTRDRSRYWLQASRSEITNLTIPAQETVTLEFSWQPEGGSVSGLPSGEYAATLTWIPVGNYRQELRTDMFTILEE